MERDGGCWTIRTDGPTFRARIVVNATGPSALDLLDRAHRPGGRHMRLVRGSHIVVPRLFTHDLAYFFQLPDGRIFFAIAYERDFTLIGTTDRDHDGGLDRVAASAEEIAYLCEGANLYFARSITPADVVWSYAGVRPLVDDGSGRPEAATRGYRLELDTEGGVPLLNILGGKITTYRHLAQEAVALLRPFLPGLAQQDWTAHTPLPGGDFDRHGRVVLIGRMRREYPFLDEATAERIGRAYGTRAWGWLGGARAAADLGMDFGHGLSAAEVGHLIEREWARSAQDVLWRRSKLGLRFDASQVERLEQWMRERI